MCMLVCPPTERAPGVSGRDAAFFLGRHDTGTLVMIELLSESLEGLSAAMIAELGRYRHQSLHRSWAGTWSPPPGVRDQEFDQFDHPQTRYIVAMGRQGICGCARLLPTTDAYLLGKSSPPVQRNPAQRSVGMGAFALRRQRGGRSATGDEDILVQPAMRLVPGRQFGGGGDHHGHGALFRSQRRDPPAPRPATEGQGRDAGRDQLPGLPGARPEMLLRYHPEWLQGVPLSMAV